MLLRFSRSVAEACILGLLFYFYHGILFEFCSLFHPPSGRDWGLPAEIAAGGLVLTDLLAALLSAIFPVPLFYLAAGLGTLNVMLLYSCFAQNPLQGWLMTSCWAYLYAWRIALQAAEPIGVRTGRAGGRPVGPG